MHIVRDNLRGAAITQFLEEHIEDMRSVSPPESKHALDLDNLRRPEITFWSVYAESQLVGCGALKQLSPSLGEIKSMRSARSYRGQGVGRQLLTHIISEARRRKYESLFLETGSMPFFAPARSLYAKFGFMPCPPFADYKKDANSVFMTLDLRDAGKRV